MTPRQFKTLLDKLTDSVRDAILASLDDVRSTARMAMLVNAVEAGDTGRVLQILSLDDAFFGPLDDALRSAYLQGGRDATAALLGPLSKSTVLHVRFSGRNDRAERWLREQSSRLIVQIQQSTRDAVRVILTSGLAQGLNPRTVALDIAGRVVRGVRTGGVIGLDRQLASYLSTARGELTQGGQAALDAYLARKLRNRSYDALVRSAASSGRRIPAATVDRIVTGYSNNLLRYRAERIARTEMIHSMNAARHESLRQSTEAGVVDERDITRKWSATGDDRTRDSHTAMDGDVVTGLRDPFVTPSGARLMHPGDTSLGAGPEEVVNCRCYEDVRIDYVAARARLERSREVV